MSTLSLPSYVAPSLSHTPSYSAEPQNQEQRLAFVDRLRAGPSGNFVKSTKGGDLTLRLTSQDDHAELPTYGLGGTIRGAVELSKTEGIETVALKIEGHLVIKELGEGGSTDATIINIKSTLWSSAELNISGPCPPSLPFSIDLPSEFTHENEIYPLPPSFYVKLSGLPGFVAFIEYAVTASVTKTGHLPKVKSKSLGIRIGETAVSTPFIFYPRSKPVRSLPPPLNYDPALEGFPSSPDWKVHESIMAARSSSRQDIINKLYLPASGVFAMSQSIPFRLTVESSAVSLAAYLPLSPTTARRVTRIQLMRQTTVDVRNASPTTIGGTKTDMWRVDCIGEGIFEMVGNAPTSISFKGEIKIDPSVKLSAFKAAGLHIKDCILFSVNTLQLAHSKAPFGDVRLVVPIRLTTERAGPANGAGLSASMAALWDRTTPSPDTAESDDKYDERTIQE